MHSVKPSSTRRFCAALAVVMAIVVGALALPSLAAAAWPTGADLVSGSLSGGIQGSQTSLSVSVSSDGRYSVFETISPEISPAGAPNGGIFRKDLTDDSAPIEIVAKYAAATPNCRPRTPSISGNGRYVAFTSGENGLVASDTNGRADVYVRDMNDPIDLAGAFELVSAPDGSSTGAAYTIPVEPGESIPAGEECKYGAKLPQNSGGAISDDGRKVVFTNNAYTNMFSPAPGNGTAPGQLFVRDLDAQSTSLVTMIAYDLTSPNPTIPVGEIGEPLTDVAPFIDGQTKPDVYSAVEPLAVISGDGTTVAWAGVWARMQAEYQASEEWNADADASGPESRFYLWKRIADGVAAKTRRVTGWVDLDDPGCNKNATGYEFFTNDAGVSAGEIACRGPLIANESVGTCPNLLAPSISRDGTKVMFGTCNELRSNPIAAGTSTDVFMADMSPGVSRKQGVNELTREIDLNDPTHVTEFALSGDGRRAAVVTARTDFSGVASMVEGGVFPPVGLPRARMFVINGGCGSAPLSSGTIQWVGRPSSGDLTSGGSPAFVDSKGLDLDNDGATATFVSNATNLYAGHNGALQALAVSDTAGGCVAAPVVEITAPAEGSTVTTATPLLSFTIDGAAGQTASCAVDGGAGSPCTSGANLSALTDGSHTVVVSKSNSGGVGSDTVTFTVDAPPPVVVITAPADGSTVTSDTPVASFTIDGVAGQSATCQIDGGASSPCTSGANLSALVDGAHTLVVSKTNSGGTGSDTVTFTVDVAPPEVVITAPADGSTVTTATPALAFTVNGASGHAATCQLDGGSTFLCVSGTSLPAIAEGAHTLTVSKSNVGGTGTDVASFTVDLPALPITPPITQPITPPPTPPVASMSLLKAKVKGETATIPVEASVGGNFTATATAKLPKGKKLKPTVAGKATATLSGAGTATLTLKLNAAAKKQLKKKRSLAVSVKVVFVARDGTKIERTVSLKFKSVKKR